MESRRRLKWIVLLVAGLAQACDGGVARQRPNVLFIAVDDLRPTIGAYGDPYAKTPNLDRLARSGVTFLRAYAQQALCNPSRASLMTGLRPDSLRVWDLSTDFRSTVPDAVTLPQHFMRHGYRTVQIGKIYHNTIPDSRSWDEEIHVSGFPFDPDAVYHGRENLAIQEARKAAIIKEGRQDQAIDKFGLWYLKANATESLDLPDSAYYDGAQTDRALEELAALEGRQPFFFAIGYYRPTCRSMRRASTGISTTRTPSPWRLIPTCRRTRRPSPGAIWPSCAGMRTSRRLRIRGREA